MKEKWVLVGVAIIVIFLFCTLIWYATPVDETPAPRCECTDLTDRVEALERLAHEAPWWLDDMMKGVK